MGPIWNTPPYLAACQAGNPAFIRRFLAEGADAYAERVALRALPPVCRSSCRLTLPCSRHKTLAWGAARENPRPCSPCIMSEEETAKAAERAVKVARKVEQRG